MLPFHSLIKYTSLILLSKIFIFILSHKKLVYSSISKNKDLSLLKSSFHDWLNQKCLHVRFFYRMLREKKFKFFHDLIKSAREKTLLFFFLVKQLLKCARPACFFDLYLCHLRYFLLEYVEKRYFVSEIEKYSFHKLLLWHNVTVQYISWYFVLSWTFDTFTVSG